MIKKIVSSGSSVAPSIDFLVEEGHMDRLSQCFSIRSSFSDDDGQLMLSMSLARQGSPDMVCSGPIIAEMDTSKSTPVIEVTSFFPEIESLLSKEESRYLSSCLFQVFIKAAYDAFLPWMKKSFESVVIQINAQESVVKGFYFKLRGCSFSIKHCLNSDVVIIESPYIDHVEAAKAA